MNGSISFPFFGIFLWSGVTALRDSLSIVFVFYCTNGL
jgi:hypothetical protein